MKKHFVETVISNELIAQNTWLLAITCDAAEMRFFRPGQFAHIKIPGANELLLRRPISINSLDTEKGEAHFAYNPVGKGTRVLSALKKGDALDVLMPLGNGFNVKPEMKMIWLIGGGIGCAPLLAVPEKFPDRQYRAFLGFRSREMIYQEEDFKRYGEVVVSTDDGSYGESGLCTACMQWALQQEKPDAILACGPMPFFKSLAKVAGDIPTQVSLEQHMGCGTGGCATCSCGIGGEYKRVCMEGPVFDIKEVDALYG